MRVGRGYSKPIRLVVAHRWSLALEGLARLVQSFEDVELVAQVQRGDSLLSVIEQVRFDVLLIDADLPKCGEPDLVSAIRRLQTSDGCPHMLFMSVRPRVEEVIRTLRDGAVGFLLRDAGTAELEAAIRTAASGEQFLCPSIFKSVADCYLSGQLPDQFCDVALTSREKEMLQLIANGLSHHMIAKQFAIAEDRVEQELQEIMTKLRIQDVSSLIDQATRIGTLSAEH